MVSSWKITEFTVMNSLSSICLYDSLGKDGSLLLFLFVIIFIFPILKKRLGGGYYIIKMLLPICGSLLRAPQNLWKFKLFCHYHTETGKLSQVQGRKHLRFLEGMTAIFPRCPRNQKLEESHNRPLPLEPWHCRNSSHFAQYAYFFYIANLKWKHFYPYAQNCFCFIRWHFTTH